MNSPNISVLNSTSRLPMKITVQGGARIPLYNGPRTIEKVSYLTPSFIYRIQGPATQLDLGVNYHIDPVSVGCMVPWQAFPEKCDRHGKPGCTHFYDGVVHEKFHDRIQLRLFHFQAFNTSGGAHEISIMYEFVAKPLHRGIKKEDRLIPCPSLNTKQSFWR